MAAAERENPTRDQREKERERRRASINRRRNEKILFDFGPPPAHKLQCPIVDAHSHPNTPERTETLVRVAQSYGVTGMLGITSLDRASELRRAFPGFFEFAVSFSYNHLDDIHRFHRDNLALLERARQESFSVVKFWFKPEFNEAQGLKLDDPRMDPLFDKMADLGFAGLAHIADPDIWFTTRYRDSARFGTKEEAFVQLERRLESHPDVSIVGAHLGGDPENLSHVSGLLDSHPNFAVDCSATKWVVRELSQKRDESRRFFFQHQDRIIFGTDLVAWQGAPVRHYASRYWTLQKLLETDYDGLSPIYDNDGRGEVNLKGLDLPKEILEKLYYRNAGKWLKIHVACRPSKCRREK